MDKIFENEDIIKRVQCIRGYGETNIVFRMLNLILAEYIKQSNLSEIHIHWTKEEGFKENKISFVRE